MKKIWLYSNLCPQGKLFDFEEAQANYETLVKDGWVKTPAQLDKHLQRLAYVEEGPRIKTDKGPTIEDHIAAVKAAGFLVMTQDQLDSQIKKNEIEECQLQEEEARAKEKDYGDIVEKFKLLRDSLTQDDCIDLSKELKMFPPLRKTWSLEVMIDKLDKEINKW